MADRIYKLASAILAAGNNIRPQAAILIAIKLIELVEQIEGFKREIAQSERFGYDKRQLPPKTLEEILSESDEEQP
jgi:hypothetical protein